MPAALLHFPEPTPDAPPYDGTLEMRKLLTELLKELDEGTISPACCAVMYVDQEHGRNVPVVLQTGVNCAEQIAYLEVAKLMVIDHWRT